MTSTILRQVSESQCFHSHFYYLDSYALGDVSVLILEGFPVFWLPSFFPRKKAFLAFQLKLLLYDVGQCRVYCLFHLFLCAAPQEIQGHTSAIKKALWCNDDRQILSAADDKTIRSVQKMDHIFKQILFQITQIRAGQYGKKKLS